MQPTSDTQTEIRGLHLRDYWRVVWRGRYTVLAVLVLVLGLAILRVSFATPVYQATAVVEIRPEARRILPGQEQWVGAEGRSWLAEEYYFNTQLEILKSRDLAERVFHRLHLQNHPRFAEATDPVGAFAGSISVKPTVKTRLVRVSITGPDPKEATEWVNALSHEYVRRNVDEASRSFTEILDKITKSLDTFRTDLGETDSQVLEAAAGRYVPENQEEILRQNLGRYNQERTDLRVKIGELAAEIQGLQRIRDASGDVMTLPRFSKDTQLQDLNRQKLVLERDLDRLASEKTARHPEYLAKRTELDKITGKMDEEITRIAEELNQEYGLARSRANYLDREIQKTEEEAFDVRQATTSYDLQKTDAESKRKVFEAVAGTVQQLSLGAQLIAMNNNVAVLDEAIEPRGPIRPRKKVTVAFALFMGLILGVGVVLFLDYLDNTIRTPDEIEQYLGLGVLAIVPKYRDINSNPVREASQSLRTSILFSSQTREKRLLLISSAGPQEGKSGTVALVSRSLASAGDRVLVMDCDLRRPMQHKLMSLPREPGITNYLLDGKEGEYEPFIQSTEIPNLDLMASGPIPPNPPELVGLSKFQKVLQDMKARYDWVLVDSPPVASLADTVVLASMTDMMILVIKHNENDRDLIRRCLKRLKDVDVEVAGAVLNSMDVDSGHYTYYMYDYYEPDATGRKKRRRLRGSAKKNEGDSRKVAL